jgi:protease-4
MDLAEIVSNTSKPIIAFADGLMASAAIWIGSAANEVIASNNKAQVGSIGVMMSFADLQPAYEAIGVKFHSIVADQSKDKNALFEAVRAGKYDDYRKEVLNPLAADFIAAIKQNRPGVKDDQLTGKVFFAESVVGSLVDSIGNFDYAVQRASELADQHKKELDSQTKKPVSMKKQYANVNQLLEVEQLEAQEEGVFLNEDQVAAIDTALANGTKAAADLQTATADKKKAEGDLAAAQQSIQEKDAEIAQLKKTAGAEPAKVVSQKETAGAVEKNDNVVSEEKSFEENLEAVRKEFF